MNILEAMSDPKLLGASFKRSGLFKRDTWQPWRGFLAAVFGLPLDSEALTLYRACTGRQLAPTGRFKEVYCISGRRSGKSRIAACIAAYGASLVDYHPYLAVGESAVVPVIASTREQAQVLLNYVKGIFSASPILRDMVRTELREGLELKSGTRLEIFSGDFKAARGRSCPIILLDEMNFISADGSTTPDVELLRALRPSQATFPGALLVGISSAHRKQGAMYDEYLAHYGKDSSSDVLIWRSASRTMNPTLSLATIELAKLRDPVASASEWDSAWREDLSSFLSALDVDAVIVRDRTRVAYVPGITYNAFCDLSGGRQDSATLAICHEHNDCAVLDMLIEKPAPHSPQVVIEEFSQLLKMYGLSECTSDRYGAEFPVSEFASHGIRLLPSDKTRSEIYLSFAPIVLSGRCQLLDDARLRSQLLGLERRAGRNQDAVDHRRGGSDDVANSAAGAVVAALGGGGLLGLVEFLKGGGAQRALDRLDAPPSPTERFAAEARVRGILNPGLPNFGPEVLGACPRCDSSNRVKLGGVGVHCNSCGFGNGVGIIAQKPTSRLDILSGRIKATISKVGRRI